MGSTGAALALTGLQAWGAWVGDSRIHIVREGRIHQLTEDQTLVHAMVKRGILTPEQAARHPERNVLLHVLGHTKEPEVALWNEPLAVQSGDCFLLTSDGVHSPAPATADLCRSSLPMPSTWREAAAHLIGLAFERGGRDDASVVLVRVL